MTDQDTNSENFGKLLNVDEIKLENGWFKFPNDIFSSSLIQSSNALLVWCKFLSMARFKSGIIDGIFLEEGQCLFSYRSLSKLLNISKNTLKAAINFLIEHKFITVESHKGNFSCSKVTILGFEKWLSNGIEHNTESIKNYDDDVAKIEDKQEVKEDDNISNDEKTSRPCLADVQDYDNLTITFTISSH